MIERGKGGQSHVRKVISIRISDEGLVSKKKTTMKTTTKSIGKRRKTGGKWLVNS